jgi:hypothetical protein
VTCNSTSTKMPPPFSKTITVTAVPQAATPLYLLQLGGWAHLVGRVHRSPGTQKHPHHLRLLRMHTANSPVQKSLAILQDISAGKAVSRLSR